MKEILRVLSSQVMFWAAWVLIPLVMEIIPSICGFFVLIKKRIRYKKDQELHYYPEITLIVPVYNSKGSLKACLDSVCSCNYPTDKIEILLVDNGSTDGSRQVFFDYQSQHPLVSMKWMTSQQGKSKALNMALFHSRGKYIIHIDSDGTLHPDALKNMVTRFEYHPDIHCMTGSVLTNPEQIEAVQKPSGRLLRRLEFFEYAQAFLVGRNYEAESDRIFTMSGAFSAFRKSTILKTRLYNPETVCEDTHVTFQVRNILKQRVYVCENAVFFVDPIEDIQRLYVQRQRWQRGELEVFHMFTDDRKKKGFFSDFAVRLLVYDHTFAFPRLIWYFALICLTFINYPLTYLGKSMGAIYLLYGLSAFLYYLNANSYFSWDKELKQYYRRKWYLIPLMPLYNFFTFWFRMAGIINSIRTPGSWRTMNMHEEMGLVKEIIQKDLGVVRKCWRKCNTLINSKEPEGR